MSHILDDTVIPQLDDGSLPFHPQILNFEEQTMLCFFFKLIITGRPAL